MLKPFFVTNLPLSWIGIVARHQDFKSGQMVRNTSQTDGFVSKIEHRRLLPMTTFPPIRIAYDIPSR